MLEFGLPSPGAIHEAAGIHRSRRRSSGRIAAYRTRATASFADGRLRQWRSGERSDQYASAFRKGLLGVTFPPGVIAIADEVIE